MLKFAHRVGGAPSLQPCSVDRCSRSPHHQARPRLKIAHQVPGLISAGVADLQGAGMGFDGAMGPVRWCIHKFWLRLDPAG